VAGFHIHKEPFSHDFYGSPQALNEVDMQANGQCPE